MPETKADILVVESNGSQRYALCRSLRRLGHHTHEAHSTSAALQFQKSTPVDLILVDLDLRRADGLRLLDALRERDPELVVILMITRSSLETALAALRGGAFDYLSKPIHSDTLRDAVARGLAQARQIQNRRFLLKSIRDQLGRAGSRYDQFSGRFAAARPQGSNCRVVTHPTWRFDRASGKIPIAERLRRSKRHPNRIRPVAISGRTPGTRRHLRRIGARTARLSCRGTGSARPHSPAHQQSTPQTAGHSEHQQQHRKCPRRRLSLSHRTRRMNAANFAILGHEAGPNVGVPQPPQWAC